MLNRFFGHELNRLNAFVKTATDALMLKCIKSRENVYSSRGLDRFERLSAEATFRTPPHTAKIYPLLVWYP